MYSFRKKYLGLIHKCTNSLSTFDLCRAHPEGAAPRGEILIQENPQDKGINLGVVKPKLSATVYDNINKGFEF